MTATLWAPWPTSVWFGMAACLLLGALLGAALPLWSARLLQALAWPPEADPAPALIAPLWPVAPLQRKRARGLWWAGSLLLTLGCALRFGANWAALAAVIFLLALWMLAWVDARTGLLPDGLTQPLLWLGLLVNLDGTFAPLTEALLGAVAGYGIPWLIAHGYALLRRREGMGQGDFKMLAALGAWLGWQALPMVLLLASLCGLVMAAWLAWRRRLQADQALVFGPWLALAGACVLLAGY
ncbi:A24 family peptidase [Castellaniella sp.]|uniref:prepilin peptidase n=1 Tax=Castellaniella sp. TaxID=1955812 RepID=UPI003560CEA0